MQTYYDGDITARSKLYAIWDEGDDDDDGVLARICQCSRATVITYRQDYRRSQQNGVERVTESNLPIVTNRGMIMWCIPVELPGVTCSREGCDMWELCQWWVHHRGFVACERLLKKEIK